MFITILILVTMTSIRQPQTISYKCLFELLTTIPFLYNILVKHFYYIVSYYNCQYILADYLIFGKDNIKYERKRKPPDALFFYLKSTEREVRTCETTDI